MSGFIIAKTSESDRFFAYDKSKKLYITNKKEKAAWFPDAGKAWRVLNNQVPKKKRGEWTVTTYDTEEAIVCPSQDRRYKAIIDMSAIKEQGEVNWKDVSRELEKTYSTLISYGEKLTLKLSQVDAELCDLEHYCEFFKCNAADGYKIYAMIRERRISRRYYKDELRRVNTILSLNNREVASGKIKEVFKEIDEQTYVPRALKEMFTGAK